MTAQTFYNTNGYANRTYTTITFGHTPTGDVTTNIEKTWGTTIPPRPEAEDATNRLAAFEKLSRKYKGTPDLIAIVRDTPPDTWEKQLADWNKTAAIGNLIGQHSPRIHRQLREVASDRRSPEEQYEHTIAHLDTAPVIDAFTTAATTLGDAVTNTETAFVTNPDATTAFRTNGQKLKTLAGLGVRMNLSNDRGVRAAARYTNIEQLPPLTAYYIRGHKTTTHTEEDQHTHDTIQQAMELANTNIDAYLTRLARGDYPHLTLNIATTADELKTRAMTLDHVGTVDTIPAPKGSANRARFA